MVLLVVVALIWVVSSVAIQSLFEEQSFRAPFFLTYACNSLFAMYLPIHCAAERRAASRKRSDSPQFADEIGGNKAADGDATAAAAAAAKTRGGRAGLRETAVASISVCIAWFAANYVYNLSLLYTSVSSSTILSSTSSFFTFVISAVFIGERASAMKLIGVALTSVATFLSLPLFFFSRPAGSEGPPSPQCPTRTLPL